MAANALVQTRIDADVRDRAVAVLEEQGMTVSEAVRILLTRTANEGALPFSQPENAVYDEWFRAKVRQALDDSRPLVTNEEAKLRFETLRAVLTPKVS